MYGSEISWSGQGAYEKFGDGRDFVEQVRHAAGRKGRYRVRKAERRMIAVVPDHATCCKPLCIRC